MLQTIRYFSILEEVRNLLLSWWWWSLHTNFPLNIPHVSTLILVLCRAIWRKLCWMMVGIFRVRSWLVIVAVEVVGWWWSRNKLIFGGNKGAFSVWFNLILGGKGGGERWSEALVYIGSALQLDFLRKITFCQVV